VHRTTRPRRRVQLALVARTMGSGKATPTSTAFMPMRLLPQLTAPVLHITHSTVALQHQHPLRRRRRLLHLGRQLLGPEGHPVWLHHQRATPPQPAVVPMLACHLLHLQQPQQHLQHLQRQQLLRPLRQRGSD